MVQWNRVPMMRDPNGQDLQQHVYRDYLAVEYEVVSDLEMEGKSIALKN